MYARAAALELNAVEELAERRDVRTLPRYIGQLDVIKREREGEGEVYMKFTRQARWLWKRRRRGVLRSKGD